MAVDLRILRKLRQKEKELDKQLQELEKFKHAENYLKDSNFKIQTEKKQQRMLSAERAIPQPGRTFDMRGLSA